VNRGAAREYDEDTRTSGLSVRATRRGEVLADTYRLLELVGAGGMAEVYSAEHLRLGRKFAVKILRGTSRQSLERFRREARAIARIDNQFVVGVIDCGEASDGTPYLVMELLAGEDLRSLLDREGALPIPRAVNLVWEACQGIAAVHQLALVHRDLKPENLYVSKRATGQDWCKVLDFGIAKGDITSSTAAGALVGTVRYMAPEQLEDAASAGPAVDVYALGAVLYECLSGTPPHRGETVQELMFKVFNEPPPRLERSRPGVPQGLADAVERALAKSSSERFADVKQFAAAIAPYAGRPGSAPLDSRAATVDLPDDAGKPSSVRPSHRKNYLAIALSGIIGLGAGAALRGPARVAPANSRSTHIPTPPRPSAAVVITPVVSADLPIAAPISVPTSSVASPKARAFAPQRRQPVSPQGRFDSENPYGK
jgi:eukaryotic-like serine/threonine-protein kinase